MSAEDDRYEVPGQPAVPEYLNNSFRNIDRHYKQRYVNTKGTKKLEPTDYTNVLDLRHLGRTSQHNQDTARVMTVATRSEEGWDWKVEPCFNEGWEFRPSTNTPVTGDGAPPRKPKDSQSAKPATPVISTPEADKSTPSAPSTNAPQSDPSQPQPQAQVQPESQANSKFYTKKHKNQQNQFAHPMHHYTPDYSGLCGSTSSQIYAVDQVPGLFVISRALHYTSQIVWALRCFLTYETDYTNLYNLHFVLPEKGVKEGLESLPDQSLLPEHLQVKEVSDIQELFMKACAQACLGHDKMKMKQTGVALDSEQHNAIDCQLCQKAVGKDFFVHSHSQSASTTTSESAPTTLLSDLDATDTSSYPIPTTTPPLNAPQSNFHTESQFDLVSLKRLRWASLGYHYDWTDREYNDHNRDPFPSELHDICSSTLSPLVAHGLVAPSLPEAGIINYYPVGSRMGAHMDDAELAVTCPIVSFSVGLSSLFVIGNQTRTAEPVQLFLRSGDCLIQDGESRLAYHSVPRIVEDSLPFAALYQASCSLLDMYYRYVEMTGSGFEAKGEGDENCELGQQSPFSLDLEAINHLVDAQSTNSARHIADQAATEQDPKADAASTNSSSSPSHIPRDTLVHFLTLVHDTAALRRKYDVSLEQVLTFLLHVLCEYRINFNTRQVQDPALGSSLADVRKLLRNRQEQLENERINAETGAVVSSSVQQLAQE